jgi:hypothetical protein
MSWPLTAVLALDVGGALDGAHPRTIEDPFLIRRATCLSFSARRSSLRTISLLIGRALRITR